jgi:hypothetical protein
MHALLAAFREKIASLSWLLHRSRRSSHLNRLRHLRRKVRPSG